MKCKECCNLGLFWRQRQRASARLRNINEFYVTRVQSPFLPHHNPRRKCFQRDNQQFRVWETGKSALWVTIEFSFVCCVREITCSFPPAFLSLHQTLTFKILMFWCFRPECEKVCIDVGNYGPFYNLWTSTPRTSDPVFPEFQSQNSRILGVEVEGHKEAIVFHPWNRCMYRWFRQFFWIHPYISPTVSHLLSGTHSYIL